MTRQEMIEEFKKTKFATEGGLFLECCDYEEMLEEMEQFLIKVLYQKDKEKMEIIEVIAKEEGWEESEDYYKKKLIK